MFAPSVPFLKYELYTEYTPSVVHADECLRGIVQFELNRQEWSALFTTSEPALQVVGIIWNNSALKERVLQILADYNSAQMRRVRDMLLRSLGYDCLLSRYSTKSQKRLARNEVPIYLAHRMLLKRCGQNDLLKFSL